jgi:SPP1 family predicted phage head-tail adaptor
MLAGKMNRQITIQTKSVTYSSFHEPIETWADYKTIWAEVITTGGTEFYAAQKLDAQTSCLFRIRYVTWLTNLMRIKFGTRYFDILSINDVNGKRVEMQVSAKEVV